MQIIVIHKGDISVFAQTVRSIYDSNVYKFVQKIIGVVSDDELTETDYKKIILEKGELIFNRDKGIYSAMNLGLQSCEKGHILFLNSGDLLVQELRSFQWIDFKSTVFFLPTILIDNQAYTAKSHKIVNHQNIVYYFDAKDELITFDENLGPLADAEWIETVRANSQNISESLAIFSYGGISTSPDFGQVVMIFIAHPRMRYFKLMLKAILIKMGLEWFIKENLKRKYGKIL